MAEEHVLTNEDAKILFRDIDNKDIIEKEASLSWDGRNIIVRIPKEISDYLNLNEENRFEKNIKFSVEINGDESKKTFDVVKRNKPKRLVKDETEKK